MVLLGAPIDQLEALVERRPADGCGPGGEDSGPGAPGGKRRAFPRVSSGDGVLLCAVQHICALDSAGPTH